MHRHLYLVLFIFVASHLSHCQELGKHFDAAYVIGLARCASRWVFSHAWAEENGLSLTRVHATEFDSISLQHPPLPVTNLPPNAFVTAGQVACTTSHIRAWRDAFKRNAKRVLILEDDVTPTKELSAQLPHLLAAADAGAKARNQPWHYIYLRAYATSIGKYAPPAWHESAPTLTFAEPSWGTAAYILSSAGVRYLLTRITSYSHPLDVQIERLQSGFDTLGAPFVALDACAFQNTGSYGCPENIFELDVSAKGECFYSASQAGPARPAHEFPSVAS